MKRLLFSLLFCTALFAQSVPQPIVLPVRNPSFEAPVPPQYQHACELATYMTPPGWTSTTGTVAVITPLTPRTCDYSNPPDGSKMLMIQNGTLSQDLGDVYTLLPHDANGEVNGVYTVHVFVANYFYWYNGKFSVSLVTEPNSSPYSPSQPLELCKTSGWGMGDFTDITFTCSAQRKYGELFLVLASGTGTGEPCGNCYENLFDEVSLIFTPGSSTTATHSVALAWNASTSTVTGYNVYRSTVSGGSYVKVGSTSALTFSDATVVSGQTYYYVATAVDATGAESVFSNEVQAVIP